MKNYDQEALSHDPLHGYIPYITAAGLPPGEAAEQHLIDHPWVQRLRQIHQLQTAWYIYPTAEHSRFEHVLGVMHLGSQVVGRLYPSLAEVCPDVPSQPYVELLVRMAGLLHDVGHGPFGHFFDEYFLADYGLTHETLGALIIEQELGPLLRRLRRTPHGQLGPQETLDPAQVALLITRPQSASAQQAELPRWLAFLRSLFCGLYTIDNLDFVLRDSYMTGFNLRAFDLERLLHYSFFSERGLTIHQRGLAALIRFLNTRAELFRNIYFHRGIRATDLALAELFAESKGRLFPHNPAERLDDYLLFTEWSLIVDVSRWPRSQDPHTRELGERWAAFLRREIPWQMAAERTIFFRPGEAERTSIFSHPEIVERELRSHLPPELRGLELRIDMARHLHRPGTHGPTQGLNFLYEPAGDLICPLSDSELFRQLPMSYRICRVYARTNEHHQVLGAALDQLIRPGGQDDRTNM